MMGVYMDVSAQDRERLMTMDALTNNKKRMSTNTLASLLFIGYLMLGVTFYCFSASQYTALDAIYFSVITFTTVGYGDTPVSNRAFTTVFVLLGAGLVGSFFGIFTNDIMEVQEATMKRKLVQASLGMNKVMHKTAKTLKDYQQKTLNNILKEHFPDANNHSKEADDGSPRDVSMRQRISRMFVERLHSDSSVQLKDMNLAIYEDELREIRSKGLVDGLFVVVSMFVGAVCMMSIEGWHFREAIYWAVVTMTTVGYGDVTPQTHGGKVFTIAYTLIGCALAAKGFRDIVTYPMVVKAKENELYITRQFGDELSEKTLRGILKNDFFGRIPNLRKDTAQITKSEFVILLLQMMGKVEDKDILLASKIFDKLDVECDGVLSEENQKEEMRKARERDIAKIEEAKRKAAELEEYQRLHPPPLPTAYQAIATTISDQFAKITGTNNNNTNTTSNSGTSPMPQGSQSSARFSPIRRSRPSFGFGTTNNPNNTTLNTTSNTTDHNTNTNNDDNIDHNVELSESVVNPLLVQQTVEVSGSIPGGSSQSSVSTPLDTTSVYHAPFSSSAKMGTNINSNSPSYSSDKKTTRSNTAPTLQLPSSTKSHAQNIQNTQHTKNTSTINTTSVSGGGVFDLEAGHHSSSADSLTLDDEGESPFATLNNSNNNNRSGISDDYHVIDPDLINVEEIEQDVGFYDPEEEAEIVDSMMRTARYQDENHTENNNNESSSGFQFSEKNVTWGQDVAYSPPPTKQTKK